MAVITIRGLKRHIGQSVRVDRYHGVLRMDDDGFYLTEGKKEVYRVMDGDDIGFRTSHPTVPVMCYDIELR